MITTAEGLAPGRRAVIREPIGTCRGRRGAGSKNASPFRPGERGDRTRRREINLFCRVYTGFVHARTENSRRLDEVAGALRAVGLEVEAPKRRGDLAIRIDGGTLHLEITQVAAPSRATIEHIVRGSAGRARADRLNMLVADRISSAARTELRKAGWGWLDRRGHVRLWQPRVGLRIETETHPLLPPKPLDYEEPLATGVGKAVAVALLLEPEEEHPSVRDLARALARAPSAVSVALRRLREQALVDEKRRPLVPELFEELSGYWAPKRFALAGKPMPGDAGNLERLRFNIDDPQGEGWVLTDTLAASAYGAPVVVGSGYPPDFYVPSDRVLRDTVNHFQMAPSYEARACTVSVPPVPAAVVHRVDRSQLVAIEYLLTRPLFVALELARDPGRGREILREWTPEGFPRVW